MATEGLPYGVHIVIGDPKLLTRLSDDGSNERVVRLNDPREEVVGCLMIEGSSEHVPEPAVSGIVLCGGHLHLCPVCVVCGCACVCVSVYMHTHYPS